MMTQNEASWQVRLDVAQAEVSEEALLEWEADDEDDLSGSDVVSDAQDQVEEGIQAEAIVDGDDLENLLSFLADDEFHDLAAAPQVDSELVEGAESSLGVPEAVLLMPSTSVDTPVAEVPEVEVAFGKAKAKSSIAPMFLGRSDASASVTVGDAGRINYYSTKGVFEAYCRRHQHCKLTRTGSSSSRANGRPLGVLSGWLGLQCTAEQHKDKAYLQIALTHEVRRMSREHLLTLPGSIDLCSFERPQADNEPLELETLKGLL
eukprot:6463501-Amphidinium_carterae.2